MSKLNEMAKIVKETPDYWAEAAKSQFVDEIFRLMEEKDMTRADLAKKMDVSPAYISKVLGAYMNFSIESMAKFAFAFEAKIDISMTPLEETKCVLNPLTDVFPCNIETVGWREMPKASCCEENNHGNSSGLIAA